MFPFKRVMIFKYAEIAWGCFAVLVALFGSRKSIAVVSGITFLLFCVKRAICRKLFVCPHCGGGNIFGGVLITRKRRDVVFCPHCKKGIQLDG